ncbi:MAG: hypothetical protein DRO67_00410 [Candidatus Asgardarchaeum californiense]|nr:MAG: hypothetical protein DRO67_00410 [Candidatus Asgardarchaeum californiense]
MILFNTIALEIGAMCNRKCWFCPNAYNTRPDEFMPYELIKKILSELGSIQYDKRIIFYIYNEPLRDKRLLDIIRLSRKTVPKATLMIATNGDYIKNTKQIQELFNSGLNQLQINVYSNMRRYRKLLSIVKETDAEEGNIYCNTSPKKKYYSIEIKFDKRLTKTALKIGRFELSNRSGHIPIGTPTEPLKRLCVRPFRAMQINWNGKVILCCNDYNADVICGDVNKQSAQDIWYKSTTLEMYRKKLIKYNRSGLKLCSTCSFKGGEYQHFIKKHWQELV